MRSVIRTNDCVRQPGIVPSVQVFGDHLVNRSLLRVLRDGQTDLILDEHREVVIDVSDPHHDGGTAVSLRVSEITNVG